MPLDLNRLYEQQAAKERVAAFVDVPPEELLGTFVLADMVALDEHQMGLKVADLEETPIISPKFREKYADRGLDLLTKNHAIYDDELEAEIDKDPFITSGRKFIKEKGRNTTRLAEAMRARRSVLAYMLSNTEMATPLDGAA